MKPTTLNDIVSRVIGRPIIEPAKRIKCLEHVPRGLRHLPERPRYIWHTYPIRGGITSKHLLAETITQNNALLRALIKS